MTVRTRQNTYEHIVRITHEYMGITAERFIDRQIRNHLQKEPRKVTKGDIPQLIHWIQPAVSILTSDTQIIDEYIRRLKQLER